LRLRNKARGASACNKGVGAGFIAPNKSRQS
jgi:hypothetical protein